MAFAKISQVAHYAPAQVVTNDDLSKIMDTSDEWIRSRTGIQERRISLNENTSDLATNVAHQLLEKSGLAPEELDFVLVATISPDSSMPSVAARVQGTIGAVNAFALDEAGEIIECRRKSSRSLTLLICTSITGVCRERIQSKSAILVCV